MSAADHSRRPLIPVSLVGKEGGDPFPCIENLWSIYSRKGIRTVFVSLGTSNSCLADLEIAESLGCPVHVVPTDPQDPAAWKEVKAILAARKREQPNTAYDLSKGAEDKWVLPKNLSIWSTLPWWGPGQVNGIPTLAVYPWAEMVCADMKVPDAEVRIDILKLDLPKGLERGVLAAVLDAGFRPGMILVHWEQSPDTHVPTTLAAGHLQNCGYGLIAKEGSKFLYYFMDCDVYMNCSWESMTSPNPLVEDIVQSVRQTLQKSGPPSEGPNGHARRPGSSVPTSGETAPLAPTEETVNRSTSVQ